MTTAAQHVTWTKYLVQYHCPQYFAAICVLSDAKLKYKHVWSNKHSLLSEWAKRIVAKRLTWFKAPGSPRVCPHIGLSQGRQNTGLWRHVSWPDSDHVAWPFPILLFCCNSAVNLIDFQSFYANPLIIRNILLNFCWNIDEFIQFYALFTPTHLSLPSGDIFI